MTLAGGRNRIRSTNKVGESRQVDERATIADPLLLVQVCMTLFLVPVFPTAYHHRIYSALFTGIFLTSAFALQKSRRVMLPLAFGITVAEWAAPQFGMLLATTVSRALVILFFVWIVIALIIEIAGTRNVTARVIIDAINGYLLLGVVFTLMVGLLMLYQPDAFNLPARKIVSDYQPDPLTDYIYYTFVTLATLGYGDVLPKTPPAKSLAILIAIAGQLYVATIIAMLVGKYAASASEQKSMRGDE
jgi:voltage-gated potassium channel